MPLRIERNSGLHVRARTRAITGSTMVELTCVVCIIAVTSAVALPRFAGSIQRQRADAAARRVAADINMAQSRANMTSTPVTVTFTFTTNQYQISGVPDLEHPLSTYTVNLSDEPYQARLISTTLGGVTQNSGIAQISFGGFGLPSAGGSVLVAVGDMAKVIAIDPVTGKAMVQ